MSSYSYLLPGSSKAAAGGGSHSLVEEERGVDRVEMLKNMSKVIL